jgi:hypothetical protein
MCDHVCQVDKERVSIIDNGKRFGILFHDNSFLFGEACTAGFAAFPLAHEKDVQVGTLVLSFENMV